MTDLKSALNTATTSSMDWDSTITNNRNSTNSSTTANNREDADGSPRKRARSKSYDPIRRDLLPVVGYHLVLVGPRALTQPLAVSLLQVSASSSPEVDGSSLSPWLTNDADILAVQALQRTIAYKLFPTTTHQHQHHPTQQRYVHLLESLDDENANNNIPTPCHVVLVTECSPQAFAEGPLYELAAVQTALRPIQQQPEQRWWCRQQQQQSLSLLVCLTTNTGTGGNASHQTRGGSIQQDDDKAACKWLLQKSGLAVFTCCHPHLESSRRTVARLLWQRCRHSLRSSSTSSTQQETATTFSSTSPLAVAALSKSR